MTVIVANIIDFIAAFIQVGSGAIKQKAKILEAREDVTYVTPIGFMTIDD